MRECFERASIMAAVAIELDVILINIVRLEMV